MNAVADPAVFNFLLLLLAIGGVGGFLSGLLGVGGGIVFVPALYFAMSSVGLAAESAMHIAVGTSMAVVFATGLSAARGHRRRGSVDVEILKSWGVFIVAGVLLGACLAAAVTGAALRQIFAVITLCIAVFMFLGREGEAGSRAAIPPLVQKTLSVLVGGLSSMIGVGGATMTVPMMSASGVPIHRAAGTASALGILISFPATLTYMFSGLGEADVLPPWSLGYVNIAAALLLSLPAVLMVQAGVDAAHALPRPVLRRIFALVLVAVSFRMWLAA